MLARDLSTERVDRHWLNEALVLHGRYVRGMKGGQRLFLRFKDARGFDLSHRDLSNADFLAARLTGCNLVGT